VGEYLCLKHPPEHFSDAFVLLGEDKGRNMMDLSHTAESTTQWRTDAVELGTLQEPTQN